MPKVYVSPSTQERNIGAGNFGTEETQMNLVADIYVSLLAKDGRYDIRRNRPEFDLARIAADSNDFAPDIHVAIHSNAGGGQGTEVWSYGPGTKSDKLGQCLYAHIAPLSPGKDRGVKYNPGLYEISNKVKASSVIAEVDFHDWAAGAQWIMSNHLAIAEALYKGTCDYFSYDYRALQSPPAQPPTVDQEKEQLKAQVQTLQGQVTTFTGEKNALQAQLNESNAVLASVQAWVEATKRLLK